jgi:hypothetical protein
MTRISGTLHAHQYTFMTTPRSVLVRMKNVSDDSCRENQNKFYVQENVYEDLVVYEIMWKNMVEPDRPQITLYGACAMLAG